MNTDATQRLAASFDAARVRAMMDTSNARTRLRKRHPYPNAPGWEDRVCGLAQVDESERRTTAALDDAWARATRLLDVGLDPASMVALLASHSEPDLRLHVEAKFPGTLPDAESPHWAMCVAIAAAAVEDPSFRAHLSHRFYYEAAAFDAAFPSAHPQHGANMSDRITVTQVSEWQWRFEFDGNKFDLLPVSRKVIDWNAFLWCDGQWQTRINSIERRMR